MQNLNLEEKNEPKRRKKKINCQKYRKRWCN